MVDPLVLVIVLNYNVTKSKDLKEMVEKLIFDLHNTRYDNVIFLLLDNGSGDNTYNFLKEKVRVINDPRFIVIRSNINLGYSSGNIFGYRFIREILKYQPKYVIFLNNDISIRDEFWLSRIISFLEEKVGELKSDLLVVQPKLVLIDEPHTLNGIGFIDMFGFDASMGDLEHDRGQYDSLKYIFYAGGSALITTSKAFEELGMFDAEYFLQVEEIDFCWRVWLSGGFVFYLPSVKLGHQSSLTLKTIDGFLKIFLQERNRLITMFKNYSLTSLLKYLPCTIFLQMIESIYLLILGKKSGVAILFAVLYFLLNLRRYLEKRRYVQKMRKRPDKIIIKIMRPPSIIRLYRKLKRHRLGIND